MVKYLIKLSRIFFSVCFLIACSSANNRPLLIDFSANRTSIVISNIGQAGLLQLKNTKAGDSVVKDLISVLEIPSETDTTIQEKPIAGKINITGNTIVFIPAMPFVKGREYLVTTYLNTQFGGVEKLAKGRLSYHIKPFQKTLKR